MLLQHLRYTAQGGPKEAHCETALSDHVREGLGLPPLLAAAGLLESAPGKSVPTSSYII